MPIAYFRHNIYVVFNDQARFAIWVSAAWGASDDDYGVRETIRLERSQALPVQWTRPGDHKPIRRWMSFHSGRWQLRHGEGIAQ